MPTDRLSIALEASGVGVWDWSLDSNEIWWSDNLRTVHGVDDESFDGTLEGFVGLVMEDDRPKLRHAIDSALSGADVFEAEFRIKGTDGVLRWMRAQGRVYRDETGRPYRILGADVDITHRRESEAAERAFGAIARASSDAIIAVELNGAVTAWNEGAERLYGYRADEMVGQHIRRIIPPDRRDEFRSVVDRLLRGERVSNFETERVAKGGRPVFVSISSGLLIDDDGRPFGAATVARDITARKREEEWQRFLADASRQLGRSLDIQQCLEELAGSCSRALSADCDIVLVDDVGAIVFHTAAHVTSSNRSDPPVELLTSLRTGEASLHGPQRSENAEAEPEVPATLERFGQGEMYVISAPMSARGTVIGGIALQRSGPHRQFSAVDLACTEDLANRAAHAVDNARSFLLATAAERQLRLIADNLPALVSYVDTGYRYRFVNRRYSEWLGIDRDALIGESIAAHLPLEAQRMVNQQLAHALAGEAVSYEMETVFPAVGQKQVDVRYVPDVDSSGTVRGLVGLVVDVGDRFRERRRSSALQQLTESLASALSARNVADRIVYDGRRAIGASAAAVAILDDEARSLTLLAVEGFPDDVVPGTEFGVDERTAFGDVARTRVPVLLQTWAERLARYPHHEQVVLPRNRGAFAAVPLLVEDVLIGVMMLTFTDERALDDSDREFLFTLASICAQALDRARLFDLERVSRGRAEAQSARHALLAEISDVLAEGIGEAPVLEPVAKLLVRDMCDWCLFDLLRDDGVLERVTVQHRDPCLAPMAEQLREQYPRLNRSRSHTIWTALDSGRPIFNPLIRQDVLEEGARDPAHFALLCSLGYAGEIVVPLRARGRSLGTVSFVRSATHFRFAPDDVRLAEEIAGRVALALDNSRLLAQSRASEARYRELFEGVADAIVVIDRSGVIKEANSPVFALLGNAREDLIGRPINEVEGLETIAGELPYLVDSGELVEFTLPRGGGVQLSVEVHAARVDLPDGEITIAGLRDTTVRQTLDRLRRDFLAMVTHDLRSPLAALRVQAQLMSRRQEYSEERLSAIISQTDRMARLIDGLADVMRMDAGQLELRRSNISLHDVVHAVVAQELARAPGRRVIIDSAGNVSGFWDGDRLFQVIANLVGNAIKYSAAPAEVRVSVSQSDQEGIVEVIDEGHGIAPEHLDKLFDRFYRAEVTGAGGLGLGLYIARLLVEAHGGSIAVRSTLGAGTTFTVRLPKVLDVV